MFKYVFKKYVTGFVLAVLFFCLGWQKYHTFDGSMLLCVELGFFAWIVGLFYAGMIGSPKTITMVMSLVNITIIIWSICTLKPLRKIIRRWLNVGFSQEPYPYLALYGRITDTQGMLFRLSPAIFRNKIPVVRAGLWRLVAREVLVFDQSSPVFRLKEWKDSPSDGIDQAFERTLYRFLEQSAAKNNGIVYPKTLRNVLGYKPSRAKKADRGYDYDNQIRFADLLNTSVSIHSYNKKEKCNIYGMKRFLKGLPHSFGEASFDVENRLELRRVWPEYVAFGYVFSMGDQVLKKLSKVQSQLNANSTLSLILSSEPHRKALGELLEAVADGTPYAEDTASFYLGLLPLAWHHDEFYDI